MLMRSQKSFNLNQRVGFSRFMCDVVLARGIPGKIWGELRGKQCDLVATSIIIGPVPDAGIHLQFNQLVASLALYNRSRELGYSSRSGCSNQNDIHVASAASFMTRMLHFLCGCHLLVQLLSH